MFLKKRPDEKSRLGIQISNALLSAIIKQAVASGAKIGSVAPD
jgi:hypothetical protein